MFFLLSSDRSVWPCGQNVSLILRSLRSIPAGSGFLFYRRYNLNTNLKNPCPTLWNVWSEVAAFISQTRKILPADTSLVQCSNDSYFVLFFIPNLITFHASFHFAFFTIFICQNTYSKSSETSSVCLRES